VRLRLTGTERECTEAVHALAAAFEVREVSSFYPNRGGSLLGRIYVDAEPRGGVIRVTAERADRDGPNGREVARW
jgi:hypothetical protein